MAPIITQISPTTILYGSPFIVTGTNLGTPAYNSLCKIVDASNTVLVSDFAAQSSDGSSATFLCPEEGSILGTPVKIIITDNDSGNPSDPYVVAFAAGTPPASGPMTVTPTVTEAQVTIEMSEVATAATYSVYSGSKPVKLVMSGAPLSAPINIKPGTVALITVKARDIDGVVIEENTSLVYAVPAPLTGVELVSQDSSSATISWARLNNSAPALTGIYARATDATTQTTVVSDYTLEELPTDHSVVVSGLSTGELYSIVLRAYNASGESTDSAIVSVQM